ncbi:MAG: peptidylprolyl isomerase [Proteobacteria bacterium]|nr:peptidylprolyl isomerase [Pseudomonadota bacterium]
MLSAIRPLVLAAAVLSPAIVLAQNAKIAAKIDGIAITEDDLKAAQDDIGASMPQLDAAQKRKYVLDYMLDLKLLARAAEKQKMAEGPDFARKLAYLKDRALMEALMTKEGNAAVSDEKLKKFYEDAIKGLPAEEEVHARHILVPEEADAKKVVARLKAGEDFAKVAGEVSKDPGSGKEGGDLGWFTKDRMVKEFADAAFAMKPGEISAPVKSQFGWHVIKLEERRNKPAPTLDDVKDELSSYMQKKAQQDLILKLRQEAKIERFDADGKPEAPAAAPAPAPAEQKKP